MYIYIYINEFAVNEISIRAQLARTHAIQTMFAVLSCNQHKEICPFSLSKTSVKFHNSQSEYEMLEVAYKGPYQAHV